MKKTAAAGLLALAILFLLPVLTVRAQPLSAPTEGAEQGTPAGGQAEPETAGQHTEGGQAPAGSDTQPGAAAPDSATLRSPGADVAVVLRVKNGDEVTEMTMAEYVWGVTAAEMPASFETEALKAQAVAARTYARYHMSHGSSAHPEADICCDSGCCQAYLSRQAAEEKWGAAAAAYAAKIDAAVTETDGVVALYGEAPINAVFHASSAGRTLNAVEVWGASVPYLAGAETPEGEEVPNYETTVAVSAADFRTIFLGAYPGADLSGTPKAWFGPVQHTSGGGVAEMEVGGVSVPGGTMRRLFALRSVNFTVEPGAESVAFHVTGYGHGVGMSQYGANALAKQGENYVAILKWYYQGIDVRAYP